MRQPRSPLRLPERWGSVHRFFVIGLSIALSLGIGWVAWDGVSHGELPLPHRYTASHHYVYRSNAPVLFWTLAILYFAAGARILYLSISEIAYTRHLTNRSSQRLTAESIDFR
jgi:hypothetical protein